MARGVTVTQVYSSPSPSTVDPELYAVIVGAPFRVVKYGDDDSFVGSIGFGDFDTPLSDAELVILPGIVDGEVLRSLQFKIVNGDDIWVGDTVGDKDFKVHMSGCYIDSISNWKAVGINGTTENIFNYYIPSGPTWFNKTDAVLDIGDNSLSKKNDYVVNDSSSDGFKYRAKILSIGPEGTNVTLDTSLNVSLSDLYLARNITGANIYTEYRSEIDLYGEFTIASYSDLEDYFGKGYIYPSSVLGYGLLRCFAAAGVKVKGWAINHNEGESDFGEAFTDIKMKKNDYFICPLTFSPGVQTALKSIVDVYAAPDKKHEMAAYIASKIGIVYNGIKSVEDGQIDFDDTSMFKKGMRVLYGNMYGATLEGVRTYIIDQIITGAIILNDITLNGNNIPITIVQDSKDTEIWSAGLFTNGIKDKRVRCVGPGYLKSGDDIIPSYFAAAAIAGLNSGLDVHYSITNEPVTGLTGVPRYEYFSSDQWETLSNAGWLIITQETASQIPYILRQMTTEYSVLEKAEMSLVESFDYLAKWLRKNLKPYLSRGIDNRISPNASDPVTRRYLDKIRSVVDIARQKMVYDKQVFASIEIKEIAPNASIKDRTDLFVEVGFYYPNNEIHVELIQI